MVKIISVTWLFHIQRKRRPGLPLTTSQTLKPLRHTVLAACGYDEVWQMASPCVTSCGLQYLSVCIIAVKPNLHNAAQHVQLRYLSGVDVQVKGSPVWMTFSTFPILHVPFYLPVSTQRPYTTSQEICECCSQLTVKSPTQTWQGATFSDDHVFPP